MISLIIKQLTKREIECLFWMSKGYTGKEIAREMNISPRTVETYIFSIRHKTSLNRKYQMIAYYNEEYGVRYVKNT